MASGDENRHRSNRRTSTDVEERPNRRGATGPEAGSAPARPPARPLTRPPARPAAPLPPPPTRPPVQTQVRRSTREPVTRPGRTAARPPTSGRAPLEGPPVMMRVSPSAERPAVRAARPKQKVKRRYDLTLSATGAEVRLPSLPRVSPGWRLVSLVMVGLLAMAAYFAWNSPAYQIDTLEVGGLQSLKQSDISAVLDVAGRPVFFLDPEKMEQELTNAFPELAAAQVEVSLPDTLLVTVTERIPVLTWRQGGQVELVDAEGFAFPARGDLAGAPAVVVEAADAPPSLEPPTSESAGELDALLSSSPEHANQAGVIPQPVKARRLVTPEMVTAALAVARQAPSGSPVLYSARHGLGWKDPGGWEVYLGDARDIEIKLTVYQAIVANLAEQELVPALISVEHVHAPYYRLGEQPSEQ